VQRQILVISLPSTVARRKNETEWGFEDCERKSRWSCCAGVEAFSTGNESEETDSGTCNSTPFQNFGSIALKQKQGTA